MIFYTLLVKLLLTCCKIIMNYYMWQNLVVDYQMGVCHIRWRNNLVIWEVRSNTKLTGKLKFNDDSFRWWKLLMISEKTGERGVEFYYRWTGLLIRRWYSVVMDIGASFFQWCAPRNIGQSPTWQLPENYECEIVGAFIEVIFYMWRYWCLISNL